jgi:hypothetical protein
VVKKVAVTEHRQVVTRLVRAALMSAAQCARDAIANLRATRKGVRLGRLSSRDLVRDGRR